MCYHVIPIIYLYFLYHTFNIWTVGCSFLLVYAFYSQYEIGYIYNDTETIKTENEPSKRLDTDEISYYESRKIQIYCIHFVCFLLFFPLLFYIEEDKVFLLYAFCAMFIEILLFFIYNRIRAKKSLIVFFFLELFKYLPFVNLQRVTDISLTLLVIAMIYAIPNTIERLSFERYHILFMQKLLPSKFCYLKFRIAFYFISCVFVLWNNSLIIYLPLFIFLLTFRSLAFFKIKLNQNKRISDEK